MSMKSATNSPAYGSTGSAKTTGGKAINPQTLLRKLQALASADPVVSAWLSHGVTRYRSGERLDVALGLTGAAAVNARNQALLDAAADLDEPGLSRWALAGRLEDSIKHFETLVLPRIRRGAQIPLSPLQGSLMAALSSGASMLRSRRRLFDLLTDCPGAVSSSDGK
jgi:hypothetical protein